MRRLKREAKEEMIEVRRADGTVARYHVWELVGAWREEMQRRTKGEAANGD